MNRHVKKLTNNHYYVLKQALKVAIVVGTLLLLINQFDALFGEAKLRWLPAILTYCVPFFVFIAGQLSQAGGDKD